MLIGFIVLDLLFSIVYKFVSMAWLPEYLVSMVLAVKDFFDFQPELGNLLGYR